MERIFFIGDIHGCSRTLRKLIEAIGLRKNDRIYCIGDYIDRGADSKGVVDFILELRANNYQVYTLRGNHEQMLLDSENGPDEFSLWLMNGGETTLKSFDINSVNDLDPVYLEFFKDTEFYVKTDEFIAVHAGLDFSLPDPLYDAESMLWIREPVADKSFLQNRILIHGHTPMDREYLLSQKFESPLNIDGGCVYKHKEGMGNLFALDFYRREFIETKNID
jgi:serine/threonine protein phosphatase 1